jgi:hypothetical protein
MGILQLPGENILVVVKHGANVHQVVNIRKISAQGDNTRPRDNAKTERPALYKAIHGEMMVMAVELPTPATAGDFIVVRQIDDQVTDENIFSPEKIPNNVKIDYSPLTMDYQCCPIKTS